MIELLMKIALLVALTHAIRTLGRIVGPRRGSLLLGLPSTTAVALVSCGRATGLSAAAEMADASLFGLIGAVALPLAFAWVLVLGRQLCWAVAAAIMAYVAVAWASMCLPEIGPVGRILATCLAVAAACRLATRLGVAEECQRTLAPSRARCLVLRTAVPVACLVAITALREAAGLRWAGLLSTFPGMTLAVLVVTYLESGAAEAGRMARALPSANLGMIAFIAAFRLGGPAIGLGFGTALGYVLASATLLAVSACTRRPVTAAIESPRVVPFTASARSRTVWLGAAARFGERGPDLGTSGRGARPKFRRRLSPLVEPIGL